MILIPTSDHPHYLWQVLVQAYWFKQQGWEGTWLFYCHERPSVALQAMLDAQIGELYVWPDWERDRSYNAAMKPWLIGKYLSAHPEKVWQDTLLIDPDCLPLRPWPKAQAGVLAGTDTHSYTGFSYLQSKEVWHDLCRLVEVDPEYAETFPGIGAQYVCTGLPGAWWQSVAELSVQAWHLLEQHPSDVQTWCAEMYVTQLMAIRDGILPKIEPSMNMIWADGKRDAWETAGFFHDAGVPTPRDRVFCKSAHQFWPENIPVVDSAVASSKYVELIQKTETEWPALVALLK